MNHVCILKNSFHKWIFKDTLTQFQVGKLNKARYLKYTFIGFATFLRREMMWFLSFNCYRENHKGKRIHWTRFNFTCRLLHCILNGLKIFWIFQHLWYFYLLSISNVNEVFFINNLKWKLSFKQIYKIKRSASIWIPNHMCTHSKFS